MPKAQKTPWAGYWEPTPRNERLTSRADRATSIYDRDVAFRQSQRDALLIAAQEHHQQRSQKRGAELDDDFEAEFLRAPKARCMAGVIEEGTSTEGSDMVAQDSGDGTEHQHANQAPTSLAVPSNGQSLDIQERLAALEGKMQSLDKTTQKHVGDIGYLLPRTTELASVDQAIKIKVDVLEKGLDAADDNILGLLDSLKHCSELGRDIISLHGRLVKLAEKTSRDLRVSQKALDETRAAQAKDRAAISSLQRELSKMRDEGITKSESTST